MSDDEDEAGPPPHGEMCPMGMMPGMMPPGMPPPGMPPGMPPFHFPGMPPGMPPGMMPPGMMPMPGMMPPGMGPPGMMHPDGEAEAVEEPPMKRRRLKGVDTAVLTKLLLGLHQCLRRLVDSPGKEAGDEDDEVMLGESPVQSLEEEFERHWRVRFDARAMGEPNIVSFLQRFPEVFRLRSNGIYMMVAPMDAPNFEAAAETGMEGLEVKSAESGPTCDFRASCAEQLVALITNFVAEDRKALGADLPFQFASYEILQDLFARLRDGGIDDSSELLSAVLDPKPVVPKEPEIIPEPDMGKGDFPPMAQDEFIGDHPPQSKGKGKKKGADGKLRPAQGKGSLCRQFQTGRCTFGSNCRFVHEYEFGK